MVDSIGNIGQVTNISQGNKSLKPAEKAQDVAEVSQVKDEVSISVEAQKLLAEDAQASKTSEDVKATLGHDVDVTLAPENAFEGDIFGDNSTS